MLITIRMTAVALDAIVFTKGTHHPGASFFVPGSPAPPAVQSPADAVMLAAVTRSFAEG